jgi:hypothetical protein
MYGRTMGRLNVYAMAGGALGRPIWTKIAKDVKEVLTQIYVSPVFCKPFV